jgi:hypothetical protein
MSTHMFLRRRFDQPLSVDDVHARARNSDWCYAIHKVDWRGSFLSTDGHTLLCWFTAIDAESVRIALRQSGAEANDLWPGTVHESSEPRVPNVIVERSFKEPVTFAEIQSTEEAAAGCLQVHRVRFARTFLSLDRRRMVCLYQAPDAESVRIAQREAALPLDNVWAFHRIAPETLARGSA